MEILRSVLTVGVLMCTLGLAGCQWSPPRSASQRHAELISTHPEYLEVQYRPDSLLLTLRDLPPKDRATFYVNHYLYQEAAWEYLQMGEENRAKKVRETLRAILNSQPQRIEEVGKGNTMKTFKVTFKYAIAGIFKVEGSDMGCRSCNGEREEAVYRLDQLMGFHLTPMTIQRQVKLPGGNTANGSLMYFVQHARRAWDVYGFKGVDANKSDKLRLFDAIIGNSDRHGGNWLVRDTGEIVAIDHNRTFRYGPRSHGHTFWDKEIDKIEQPWALNTVYDRFRILPDRAFEQAIRPVAGAERYFDFIEKRNKIIEHLEARIIQGPPKTGF